MSDDTMVSPFQVMHEDEKPYRGPEAFRTQDSGLFHGRRREARALLAKILGHRVTMLYARSGAGKTSLINARLLLDLERERRRPVLIYPQEKLIETTIVRTLQELMPPPVAELLAIERALHHLDGCDEKTTMGELRGKYTDIPLRDRARRLLVSPVNVARRHFHNRPQPLHGPSMPYFCRVLRGSIDFSTFGEQLTLYTGDPRWRCEVTHHTRLADLIDLLTLPANAYDRLLDRLLAKEELPAFFDRLFETFFDLDLHLSLVLIFDQFEVLFTRFVDVEEGGPGSIAERQAFFTELEKVYLGASRAGDEIPDLGGDPPPRTELPIRWVISIRQDFIAMLDDLRRLVPGLHEHRSYHLDFLTPDAAEEAILEPARHFDLEFTQGARDRVFERSRFEGRLIDPTYMQIICDHLWHKVRLRYGEGDATTRPVIDESIFDLEERKKGILTAFFRRFLKEQLESEEERLEALEMLQELITPRGTRNSVLHEDLIEEVYRRPELRRDLLDKMEKGRIVRVEQRLGNLFIEITLERMIDPIQKVIAEKIETNFEYQDFGRALKRLGEATQSDFREEMQSRLKESDIRILEKHQNRLQWGYLGRELMLRSAILEDLPPEEIGIWVKQMSRSNEVWDARQLLEDTHSRPFALDELHKINLVRDDTEFTRDLDLEQMRRILRSSILMEAGDKIGRRNIIYWTERLLEQMEQDGT